MQLLLEAQLTSTLRASRADLQMHSFLFALMFHSCLMHFLPFPSTSYLPLIVTSNELDFVEMTPSKGWAAHATVAMRVTTRGGQFHEDLGTGSTENQRTKADAISLARKEAATDARKRTLKNFGNALGNSLYDRQHLNYMQSSHAAYRGNESVTDAVMREPPSVLCVPSHGGAAMAASPVTPGTGGARADGGGSFAPGSGFGPTPEAKKRRTNQFGGGGGGGGGESGGGAGAGGGGGTGVGGGSFAQHGRPAAGGGGGGGAGAGGSGARALGMPASAGGRGSRPGGFGGSGGGAVNRMPLGQPPNGGGGGGGGGGGPGAAASLGGPGAADHQGPHHAAGSAASSMREHMRAQKARADGAPDGPAAGGGAWGVPPSGRHKSPRAGIGMGAPARQGGQFQAPPVAPPRFQPRGPGRADGGRGADVRGNGNGPPPFKPSRSAGALANETANLAELVGNGAFDDDPCTASS